MLVEILHHTKQKGDRGIVNDKGGRKVALFRRDRMDKGQVKQKVSLLRKYVQREFEGNISEVECIYNKMWLLEH